MLFILMLFTEPSAVTRHLRALASEARMATLPMWTLLSQRQVDVLLDHKKFYSLFRLD
jgi:hypothetical protein